MASAGWIVDASVAVKWFRSREIEPDRAQAEALIARASIRTTNLCLFEVGNALALKTRDSDEQIGLKLSALVRYCGPPIDLLPADYASTSRLVRKHGLTFYDASYVAIAERLGRKVISADRDLLGPGLAVDIGTALEAV
jgi:predicted nucleic acid-binding protein